MRPEGLKCEYAVNPLGIDAAQPRFSWLLESDRRGQVQTAYQVLVASAEQVLADGAGDKWDSGKVESDRSVNVPYEGGALASGEKCYWQVRCWDKDGEASPYSVPATFEMGLLDAGDWQGKWIGTRQKVSSPLLRKTFTCSKPARRARVYVCGLGYYELHVNGRRVGDHVLDPATTYYRNIRPFELQARVLYVTYDVTEMLREGANVLAVMLGHGWYSADGDPPGRTPYADRPTLL
ncbi:MAG: alpha-L-rhamnosidase N-terminal domain-containing protein, partial [Candidatus Brocadiae bacterium]|nr:alpha-L-rhamnosidase N-terminal domain-containing protein [Candidatus Brocadiia bacterium]